MTTEGIEGLLEVLRGFAEQHWHALEMVLVDPDGRELSVQAPLPEAPHHA